MAKIKAINLNRIIEITRNIKMSWKYGIKEIGIFGSFVRGEDKEKSDLNILVEFEENKDIDLL